MKGPKPLTVEDENGVEHVLPTRFDVCPTCEGHGVHDHPAFANGLTSEDFDEDPDFREDYFAGHYDVCCEECRGERVVSVVDEDKADPALLALWREKLQADADYAAECAAERRMGA